MTDPTSQPKITNTQTPQGVPVTDLMRFVGTLSNEEAEEMLRAIEDCEQIDYEYYERMDRLFEEIGWTSAPIEDGTSEQPVEPDNQPE